MEEPRLVMVEWVDTVGAGRDWMSLEKIQQDTELATCRSAGWLVKETDDRLVIVPHIHRWADGHQEGCGDMVIPRGSVLKIVAFDVK